mgnify:CR=1 FL=1
MSSLTSLRNLDIKGFKAKGDMIRFMLLVVLTGYNIEKELEEGQNLEQTSSWEADLGNIRGKRVPRVGSSSHGEEWLITERFSVEALIREDESEQSRKQDKTYVL